MTARLVYDADDNSRRTWAFGVAAQREIAIRTGKVREPLNDREARWKAEGMPTTPDGRPDYRALECVRHDISEVITWPWGD